MKIEKSIRFLHTSDWQLGMTRHFFSEGTQDRFSQARFDSIRTLGRVAQEENCQFIVVCGDVFESNQVDRRTIARAIEALKEISIPVYLLPGNHDPLDEASVYYSSTFTQNKPRNTFVIETSDPITVEKDVEIIGVPWNSKFPIEDLTAKVISVLNPVPGKIRILITHGIIDALSPNPSDTSLISKAIVEDAIIKGKIQYLAIGDRHSLTKVGETDRIWYSGTPEQTDYNEVKPGCALIVTCNRDDIDVKEIKVGSWEFIERSEVDCNSEQDITILKKWFENLNNKERLIIKLRLVGTLSLELNSQIESLFEKMIDVVGALEIKRENLVVVPKDSDFEDFNFSGFVNSTITRLRSMVEKKGKDGNTARDALALLIRLARKNI